MMQARVKDAPCYEENSDEELIGLTREGDHQAMECLLQRFRVVARSRARSYFLQGGDREDLVQEGMIGLYKAVRDFDEGRETSFGGFADVCITRQILSAVKAASRKKHAPLNTYMSLSGMPGDEDESDRLPAGLLQTPQMSDPAELLVASEDLNSIRRAFASALSDFEVEVLHLYMEGKSYRDISAMLSRGTKAIDNAIQRIRKKVDLHVRDEPELVAAVRVA